MLPAKAISEKLEGVQCLKRSGYASNTRPGYTNSHILEEYLHLIQNQPSLYLFPSEKTGKALPERALGHLIKKYALKAKVLDVSPHDLRHCFSYRMAQHVPLHRLAQIMGHASLDTTLIYVRGTGSDLQKEVEKIAWE